MTSAIWFKSPFNYTGSKFKLLPVLEQYLPVGDFVLYDICTGGGSIAVNFANKFQNVVANDVVTPLMQFYRWLQVTDFDNCMSIIQHRNLPAMKSLPDNDIQAKYLALRQRFNEQRDFIDFFILVSCCTNNMMRFNKKFEFNQTWGKRNFNESTMKKLKDYHSVLYQNNRIKFVNSNFYELSIPDNAFVYIDPPYLITEAGYNAFWSKELEVNLYDFIDMLDSKNIKFMLSNVAEHKGVTNPYMKRICKYSIIEIDFNYNKVSKAGCSNSKEIIVKNY